MISHDRQFLNNTVDEIIEIENKKMYRFVGDYDNYKSEKLKLINKWDEEYVRFLRKKAQLEKLLINVSKISDGKKRGRAMNAARKRIDREIVQNEKETYESKVIKDVNFDTDVRSTKLILRLDNVAKSYEDKEVFADLDFELRGKEKVWLFGPNGAGKSTTIHCITGIAQPTSGQILIDGIDVVEDYKKARTKVGLSPQEFNVDIFATPRQLMSYMGGYYGIPREVRSARIDELITQFDLEKHQNMKFQKLSGGLKRRAMLGRALVHTPDLLILDEPTAGVDVEQRHDLWRYLKELNEAGKTIILTSHYLEEIQYLCNEIAIINHGKIVAEGTKEEFMKDGKSIEERYLEITRETKKV